MNPLSSLYGIATAARNNLYDRGILKSHRLSRPVISVGNISVGGSGKTPFVILLGELLNQRGIAFDVLSRGYGRATRGALRVDPNGSSPDFGDEPLLITRRLGCPVFVGESRYEAGKLAEHAPLAAAAPGCSAGPQLHILDDGFQHRSLARDFDIVLLTPSDLHDRLLPSGRLREPISSLRRADAVVLTEEVDAPVPAIKYVWRVRRSLSIPQPPQDPIVFCGIARPHKFIEQLRANGVQPVATKFYPDHHHYTGDDVRDLVQLRDRSRAAGFITTEKDEINLGGRVAKLAPLSVARVEMELVDSADAIDTILNVIARRRAKA